MNILVINAGSASLKFAVIDFTKTHTHVFDGEFEHFHDGKCQLHFQFAQAQQYAREETIANVEQALQHLPNILEEFGLTPINAIGHRVAHGGTTFTKAVIISDEVQQYIASCTPLAPLHNPLHLAAITQCRTLWPNTPQVAVFDTAFHHTLRPAQYTYAIPQTWQNKGFRRYGFHGSSHQFNMLQVEKTLNQSAKHLRIISCHLGSGSSICAIEHGKSIDTSMGMTPLEGLVMGTRSGDVDPGLFAWLARTEGLNSEAVEQALYKESGLVALTGTHDMREIEHRAQHGDTQATLAINLFVNRLRKTIGAYAAELGGVDVLTFSGGIGENSQYLRERICEKFSFLGLQLDHKKNASCFVARDRNETIHAEYASVKILVIKSDEQWMIAKEVDALLAK